jgi:hypothetical protein
MYIKIMNAFTLFFTHSTVGCDKINAKGHHFTIYSQFLNNSLTLECGDAPTFVVYILCRYGFIHHTCCISFAPGLFRPDGRRE